MFDRHEYAFQHGRGCGEYRFARSPRDHDMFLGGWAGGPRHGRGRHEFGGRRERLFDSGDFRLVILRLLAEQPSYGYQLIKTLEELMAGGYSPSAGVIYPTLTMLEEEGLIASTLENEKKVYRVTAEGQAYLDENRARVDELFARLDETGRGFERGRSPELMKSFRNLRGAISAKLMRGNATAEQLRKIAEIIDSAAQQIDEV